MFCFQDDGGGHKTCPGSASSAQKSSLCQRGRFWNGIFSYSSIDFTILFSHFTMKLCSNMEM